MFIKKRNGSLAEFDKNKIINAINKAFLDVDRELYETDTAQDIADEIEAILKDQNYQSTVEEIQDLVEDYLMSADRKDVARSYIRYRYLHGLARNDYKDLMDIVSEKLNASNVQNQNANVDEKSFGGRIGEASDAVSKKFALDYCVSPMARANHLNNEIYIHDLSAYPVGSHNCLSIPFDDLLAKGFNTRQTSVRPAQSINTAFQLVAVIFQLQSLNQFGGVSSTHLDWTMVPYVRKSYYKHIRNGLKYMGNVLDYKSFCCEYDQIKEDAIIPVNSTDWSKYFGAITIPKSVYKYAYDMTKKEVDQAVEGLLHNLNTLQSRSGN